MLLLDVPPYAGRKLIPLVYSLVVTRFVIALLIEILFLLWIGPSTEDLPTGISLFRRCSKIRVAGDAPV